MKHRTIDDVARTLVKLSQQKNAGKTVKAETAVKNFIKDLAMLNYFDEVNRNGLTIFETIDSWAYNKMKTDYGWNKFVNRLEESNVKT